jgi:hypothetical protein
LSKDTLKGLNEVNPEHTIHQATTSFDKPVEPLSTNYTKQKTPQIEEF